MTKRFSISISEWVFEQYLTGITTNRSKFIEEMLVKGINSELGEFKGVQAKAIEAIKELREKERELINVKKELELVKSRIMTQEKRQQKKDDEIRSKAYIESMKRLNRQALDELARK